jgi:hypothetical protein
MPESATATDARVVLLERLFDHAPLFPPASMSMPEALAEDRRAQASAAAFMLGRFVVPVSRLGELGRERRTLSVVADGPIPADKRIEAIEVPPNRTLERSRVGAEIYIELTSSSEGSLRVLGRRAIGAKVRCGGAVTPTVAELARVVHLCREHGVAFKATAGLHYPVRLGEEHGFLNLLAAVVFGDEEAALADEDRGAFVLDEVSFRWRDREASVEELAAARERFHAIGSCSFFEPAEELAALDMLP